MKFWEDIKFGIALGIGLLLSVGLAWLIVQLLTGGLAGIHRAAP